MASWIPSGIFYFWVLGELFTWQRNPFSGGEQGLTLPARRLDALMLTAAFQGRCHLPHFTEKEAGPEWRGDLPKVMKLSASDSYPPRYPLMAHMAGIGLTVQTA